MYFDFFSFNPEAIYPDDIFWRPAVAYPEYRYVSLGLSERNDVYSMIRDMFVSLNLDSENYGTKEWNPLGEFIKEGQTVLVKPNLVRDINRAVEGREGFECLITHPSVIRCIVDYILIALNGTGKIIVADAPVQGCDFERLLNNSRLHDLEEFYGKSGVEIKIEDLRLVRMESEAGVNVTKANDVKYKGIEVDLGNASRFYNDEHEGKVRITNYDYHLLNDYHKGSVQKYCISQACLEADVIVNICKPKSHRKAGYTGALKNMIGVNAAKEYLPHHTKGSKEKGYGDEYLSNQFVSRARSTLGEQIDFCNRKERYTFARLLQIGLKVIEKFGHKYDTEKYREGSWWGNDTIWKTILDVNRIIKYADKQGHIQDDIQRTMITFGDMILCGEKEGPLMPTPKHVGGILFADNAVVFDLILTKLMGFDRNKLAVISNAIQDEDMFTGKVNDVFVHSNEDMYNCRLDSIEKDFAFVASDGWTGVIDKY